MKGLLGKKRSYFQSSRVEGCWNYSSNNQLICAQHPLHPGHIYRSSNRSKVAITASSEENRVTKRNCRWSSEFKSDV